MGKETKHKKKSHTGKQRSQPFSKRCPQGCMTHTRKYGKDKQINKKDPQKKNRLGRVSKKITGEFKLVLQ